MSEEFKLVPKETWSRRGGARPGAGRPYGSHSRFHTVLWRRAKVATGEIQRQHIDEAQRYSEYMRTGDMKRARFSFDSGKLILDRTWPEPRGAPIQVSIDNRQGIVDALEAGDLTPSDAAALLRTERLLPAVPVEGGNGASARETLAKRLERVVEGRPQPEPVLPPEMTEEQILKHVEEAVLKKLEGRNV